MDRKKFQNMFTEVDEFLIAAICDDIELCEEIEYPVYSKYFYPPQICKKLSELNLGNIEFILCGLNENCEKNMVAITPKSFPKDELKFPVKFFKITNKSKFKPLEHKHYLGTIMSLGVKRELIGDLIVEGNICYGIADDEIFNFLSTNLTEIAKNPVTFEESDKEEIPEFKFQEITDSVSSLRLDNIIAAAINNSRSKSLELIEAGEVSINYTVSKDKSLLLKEGDIISVKKKGKFIFDKLIGENKKGKYKVLIKKFV